jgi:hypothetical protein
MPAPKDTKVKIKKKIGNIRGWNSLRELEEGFV